MLSGPNPVAEPHKELRFTRGAQAVCFAVLGAISGGAAVALLLLNVVPKDPILSWWAPLVPLPIALACFRLAYRCVRHAYIILTPLGIEIFPFFGARQNLRVVYWSEIAEAEVDDGGRLLVHFDAAHRSGVVASLAPILPSRRDLLARAVAGRMKQATES